MENELNQVLFLHQNASFEIKNDEGEETIGLIRISERLKIKKESEKEKETIELKYRHGRIT